MFELAGVREDVAQEALRRAAQKLPIKCKIIDREEQGTMAATGEVSSESE